MNSHPRPPKAGNADGGFEAPPPKLLDQVRARIRFRHYSIRTEQAYVYWIRYFIRHHGLRHPRDMGAVEVESFLCHLANERGVAPSTHNQALSALLFLYREVLGIDLPWMQDIGRPRARERVPTVLSRNEVARLLDAVDGVEGVLARLLYGTGMRMMEALRLRVKDVDFERKEIVVREGKGGKDRRVMLPDSLSAGLRRQIARAHGVWPSGVGMCGAAHTGHGAYPTPLLCHAPAGGRRRPRA